MYHQILGAERSRNHSRGRNQELYTSQQCKCKNKWYCLEIHNSIPEKGSRVPKMRTGQVTSHQMKWQHRATRGESRGCQLICTPRGCTGPGWELASDNYCYRKGKSIIILTGNKNSTRESEWNKHCENLTLL